MTEEFAFFPPLGSKQRETVTKIRKALYRPFTKASLFFDLLLNEEVYSLSSFFPRPNTSNASVCVTDIAGEKPFMALACDSFCDLHLASPGCGTQCFPFYSYSEDGSDRLENITDWALEQFRRRYPPLAPRISPLTKWDIFYYDYAILHHPQYRERYAANLRRDLPHIPLVAADVSRRQSPKTSPPTPDDTALFHAFAAAGKQLADLHIGYEQAKEYPLTRREKPGTQLNWHVEKMRLTRDKTALVYIDFLTLEGIPPETFEYRLGNRSALEWVIDQYQVSTDKRSGITNDPNRPDDPQYILRLIAQVITVSLETVKIVKSLPPMQTD
jgi:predicted helicase